MGQAGPGTAGLLGAFGASQLELVVVVVAAVLLVGLVALKAKFSHDRRLRIGASSGYHQRDVARYASGGVQRETAATAGTRTRPLAPTFTAPPSAGQPKPDRPSVRPPPVPSAAIPNLQGTERPARPFGTVDPMSYLLRSFEPAEAERLRPPTPLPSAVARPATPRPAAVEPQEVPSLETEEEIPPPAGALPLLAQPPASPADGDPPPAG